MRFGAILAWVSAWNNIFIPTLRFIKMRATRARDALKRYEVHHKPSLRDGDAA